MIIPKGMAVCGLGGEGRKINKKTKNKPNLETRTAYSVGFWENSLVFMLIHDIKY